MHQIICYSSNNSNINLDNVIFVMYNRNRNIYFHNIIKTGVCQVELRIGGIEIEICSDISGILHCNNTWYYDIEVNSL